ncbi:ubiquitin carboxyl-terminal hydrolase 2 [Xylona heveae TC161]|uniref:Ubiquitin carboxyl-terminal hydrolase n=1 Tax=Xylona heveae (strain CBS 132557 / TC161) TaxID=1328760 RepID=A0A164ZBK0_XYLHT|nr:ubiquitin carboxyl-terminal hydrolase 2 [Xylona heveae TC161]KZF18900.1 ubiquitin carboxyl-terminal hydrolase 2 [Xylona heveae TC161]
MASNETIVLTPNSNTASTSPSSWNPKFSCPPDHLRGPAYGCEHLQELLSHSQETIQSSLRGYIALQRAIFTKHSMVSQTAKFIKGRYERQFTSFTPTYLCLQCPTICTQEEKTSHWNSKRHSFAVESRSGCLYCHCCEDFVYDPMLEDIRLAKHQHTGSLGNKKRKYTDFASSTEHERSVGANTDAVPCQAAGLRGLYNMGQTCFMSVILQSLIHNPLIRNFFLSDGHRSDECSLENCVSCALDEIFSELFSIEKSDGFGAVGMLYKSWASEQALAGYQQQDAHEYFQSLLNQLHSSNGGKEAGIDQCNCIVHKLFYGKLQSTVTCEECQNTTTAEDPVMDLSLHLQSQLKLPKNKSFGSVTVPRIELQDCLARYTSEERLEPDEYTCQNCHVAPKRAVKQLTLKRLPPILCIQLKKFEHSRSAAFKIESKLHFPLKLDMTPYTTRYRSGLMSGSLQGSYVYELSSVIVHKGSLESGHYISYSREGNEWFMFDDNKVTLALEAEVLEADAYLLFYIVRAL